MSKFQLVMSLVALSALLAVSALFSYPIITGCQSDWNCRDWGTCINSTQSRVCNDKSSCNPVVRPPITTRACKCSESWVCTNWSDCIDSSQTRACVDENKCGTSVYIPSLQVHCSGSEGTDNNKQDEVISSWGGSSGGGGGGGGGGSSGGGTVCSENWNCSSWNECYDSSQTRTCTDLNSCGTTVNRPTLNQSCSCTENWNCTSWSGCINYLQSRTCTDLNSCGTTSSKPSVSQACLESESCADYGSRYSQSNSTIMVFADNTTYESLVTEITRYVDDIENDLGTNVTLKTYSSNTDASVIKSDIQTTYLTTNLTGVVFIGNIPFKRVNTSFMKGVDVYSDPPDDRYYQDIRNECDYNSSGDLIFTSLGNKCYLNSNQKNIPFWIGRIKPPVTGAEAITMLDNYFDRNHNYRTGTTTYQKKLLAYLEILEDPGFSFGSISTFEARITNPLSLNYIDYSTPLYALSNVTEIAPAIPGQGFGSCVYDSPFLSNLSIPYEMVYVASHGSFTQNGCGITSSTVRSTQPNAMFYQLDSCVVGDFSQPNYIAGEYIFSGNGLIARNMLQANMIYGGVNMGGDGANGGLQAHKADLFLLVNGETFGEAFRLAKTEYTSSGPKVILGDPTLKMRYTSDSGAKACIKNELNMSNLSSMTYPYNYSYLNIKNIGTTGLTIATDITFNEYNSSSWQYSMVAYVPYELRSRTIDPNETATIDISSNFPANSSHSGEIRIITNDKDNPLIVIPFNITKS